MRFLVVAVSAVVILANVGTSTAVLAQTAEPDTQNLCVFRNELYSFGTFICIGKDRALRCDGAAHTHTPPIDNAHWVLVGPDAPNPYSDDKLDKACSFGGSSASP